MFAAHEKRILSFFVGVIFEYLLILASLGVEYVGVSLRKLWSPMSSARGYAQLFDTDRHGTIQPIIFEVIFSTAAFGSVARVDQTVQLDVSG